MLFILTITQLVFINCIYLNCYPEEDIEKDIKERIRGFQSPENVHNRTNGFDTKRNKFPLHRAGSPSIGSTKDNTPLSLRSNISYRIPCKESLDKLKDVQKLECKNIKKYQKFGFQSQSTNSSC